METLRRTLGQTVAEHPMELVWPLLLFVAVMAAGWLARRLVMRALAAWNTRSLSRKGQILAEALHGPMLIWTLILAIHLALESSEIPSRYTFWTSRTLLVLWILSLTIVGARLAGNMVRYYGDQVPGALPVTTLTQNLAQLAVVLLGIVLLLRGLGLEITPILTALGVGGLAVALALQDTLSNLFSGFYVAVAKQIRLGDYIKLNTNEEGYVTDIGWRSTSVRALANNMIIIPNAKLAQAIVTNYYLPEKRMGTSVQVAVSCDSDPDKVEKALLVVASQAVKEIPGMLSEPAPAVTFDPGFGDWSLGFTLGFQIQEFSNQYSVRSELRKRILRKFRDEGIEMPFPTRTIFTKEQS